MENFKFFLVKINRCRRRELLQFVDALTLYLRVGWDLRHAWTESFQTLRNQFESDLVAYLSIDESSEPGISQILGKLSAHYPQIEHRVWFSALEILYQNGAGLVDAVEAISTSLRKEQERDFEQHCRVLPTRVNVVIILFFLPPTLVLLFAPLLLEIGRTLAQ